MNALRGKSLPLVRSTLIAAFALGLALSSSTGRAQTFARLEVHTVPTVTLSTQQFLTGDKNGKPSILAGELRIPKPGTDRLPAVVLIHGSGGLGPSHDRWAQELNSIGVAAFILDSFAGRGIVNAINDQSQLATLAMMVDAYRALAILAEHPRIDPNRIAVMGFSKGAVAAVYSSNERFNKMYGPAAVQFAAHIGLYTPCNVTYHDDTRTTGKPIRMFHGIADDYVPIGPCRSYVERLKNAGSDVTLMEFADAYHAYDNFTLAAQGAGPIQFPQGQTTRNCVLEEGSNGEILNSKTGKTFDLSDPCVERGPHIAYNAAAHEATVQAVKEFLRTSFGLKAVGSSASPATGTSTPPATGTTSK